MGSDTCGTHLSNLTELLDRFERDPKEIIGRRITTWFQIGEDIFKELFKLGYCVKWQLSDIKNYTEVFDISSRIEKNYDWLENFLTLYPNFRIHCDFVGSADDICQVRSGIDVLLKGFADINDNLDRILKDLNEKGEVDEIDRCLKLWIETGHRPDFQDQSLQVNLLEEHWWWA